MWHWTWDRRDTGAAQRLAGVRASGRSAAATSTAPATACTRARRRRGWSAPSARSTACSTRCATAVSRSAPRPTVPVVLRDGDEVVTIDADGCELVTAGESAWLVADGAVVVTPYAAMPVHDSVRAMSPAGSSTRRSGDDVALSVRAVGRWAVQVAARPAPARPRPTGSRSATTTSPSWRRRRRCASVIPTPCSSRCRRPRPACQRGPRRARRPPRRRRWPQHFRRQGDGSRQRPDRRARWPLDGSSLHPLDVASRLVQEDLIVMIEHRRRRMVFGAGSVCFPNRWDLRSKLGRSLPRCTPR